MADKTEIKKLTEYRCQINNIIVESMKESVTKLNEAMAMIADIQNINEVLATALAEADQENQSQAKDIDILKQKIKSMKEAVMHVDEKEKQYAEMDLSMAKISALLAGLEEREKKLSVEENRLVQDRQSFEEEKDSIISARLEAEEKANRHLKNRNEAIKLRDIAIAERDKALEDKRKAEAEKDLEELREELAEYSNASTQDEEKISKTIELMEWYRNYAIAVDRKIIDFFRNKNEDLDGHYYTFLNNPDKLEEIHIHFPDYVIEEDSNEVGENGNFEKLKNVEEHKEADSNDDVVFGNYKVAEDKVKKNMKDKKDKKSDRPEFLD